MNRSDIIKFISRDTGLTQAVVSGVMDSLADHIAKAVSFSDPVDIHGLLKIKVEAKPERTGRNPSTGAAILIPAKNVVKITPAKALTDAANT